MAPKLYMFIGSPPVRAVMMTAQELGIELELKELDMFGQEHLKEDFIKINPAHTIPTLDDDGFILFESAAIMEYLVNKYGKDDTLCPKDNQKHAIVVQLLHLITSTFNRLLTVFKPIVHQGKEKSDIPQEHKDNLFNSFQTLEAIIGNKTYLTGDNVTIADLSLATLVSSVKIAFPAEMERFPKLGAWLEKLEQRPSYEINRKGLNFLKEFWASKK
ncbi:hypothetical protein WA026_020022 [Henosepilachna vigintioctopunctata]|uniref:Glutathione transferase n=1 Tax=Henosepilachna vigintioctopunctata TaxID=420089 RepID=A0AAW1UX94_9CUCU